MELEQFISKRKEQLAKAELTKAQAEASVLRLRKLLANPEASFKKYLREANRKRGKLHASGEVITEKVTRPRKVDVEKKPSEKKPEIEQVDGKPKGWLDQWLES